MRSFFVKHSEQEEVQLISEQNGVYDYADKHVLMGYCCRKDDGRFPPISYYNDRFWLVFDGEFYYEEKGAFNPEIILDLYSKYKEKIVDRLRGMFAFVIWDREEKVLFGARDRFGIKPFFYFECAEEIFYASEMKSILDWNQCLELNLESFQHYLTYQFVPEPETMRSDIRKLEPGHFFTKKIGAPMEITCYWKASFNPIIKHEDEFIKEIKEALIESIHLHLPSESLAGSFLSGGIDSTIIAAIAKEINPKLKTFTVGFQQQGYSEVDIAEQTADILGIENISRMISPEEFIAELPKIAFSLENPLADPACIPLYFAAKEAGKHVKVVLSGEGADELFGGYRIYQEPESLKLFQYLPDFFKILLRSLAKLLPDGIKGKSFMERGVTPLEERYIGNAKIFSEQAKQGLYKQYDANNGYTKITAPLYQECAGYDEISRMQYIDLHTWLRGDILLKADKMARAHSLELRLPFLDKKVFEIAAQIPSSFKIANGTTKYILRKAVEEFVPNHVQHRQKLGFPVPIRIWLKNEMYDWAKKIIRESDTDHLFNKDYVYQLLDDHCMNKQDNSRKLWTVIMFMEWYSVFVEGKYDNNLHLSLTMGV